MGIGTQDRVVGCILGGAFGDALGGRYEDGPPPADVEIRLGGLSDDTQLTLATCEALIEGAGKVEPVLVAARFADWHRQRKVTGYGAATLGALDALVAGGHWALAGRQGEMAAGNGAAMRIAPLAFVLHPSSDADRTLVKDVCRITHRNDEAYVGALAVITAVRIAANGEWGFAGLEQVASGLPDTQTRDRLLELAELGDADDVAEVGRRFGASGWVVESVPLALFAATHLGRLGVLGVLSELIKAGGDTDTTASIAGQVMGTQVGAAGVPPLVCEADWYGEVLATASAFARVVARGGG